MSSGAKHELRKRSEELNSRIREFGKTVQDINRYFRNLGFGAPVWHPEKVHSANLGGVDADCYIGYSRIEGKWGLNIRIIERDHETRAFVSQRVYSIETSGNMEIVVHALKKVPELMALLDTSIEQQVKTLARAGTDFEELRNLGREA